MRSQNFAERPLQIDESFEILEKVVALLCLHGKLVPKLRVVHETPAVRHEFLSACLFLNPFDIRRERRFKIRRVLDILVVDSRKTVDEFAYPAEFRFHEHAEFIDELELFVQDHSPDLNDLSFEANHSHFARSQFAHLKVEADVEFYPLYRIRAFRNHAP